MRKQALSVFFLLVMLLPQLVFSQSRQVTGKVVDSKGEPLPLASVVVKGTSNGVTADENGNFSINVSGNNVTLVVSSAGLPPKEIRLGAANTYNIALDETGGLAEVVVTALGVRQEKKALGYAVQEVGARELTKGRDLSIVNGLQGKVAGVNITSSGGAAGAGSSIIIRGITSLSATQNNQPLFVIDGIPVSNNTFTGSVMPSAGSNSLLPNVGFNNQASGEQFSFSNRVMDINPEDIESVSILKGAGATALYGLQAANGVVIITTKRGAAGAPKISLTSSAGFDRVLKYPEIQRSYREGFGGRLRYNSDGSPLRFQSFGPPVGPGDVVYENFKNFFQTGKKLTNTINVSGGNDRSTYYTSFSHFTQDGIVPGSDYKRYTFKLSATSQISTKFSISGSANYVMSGGTKPSAGDKGVMSDLSYFATTVDVNDYINPDGSMKSYSPGILDNPVYAARYSTLKDRVNRFIGNMGFTYNILPGLKFDYKIGGDFFADERTRIVPGPRFEGDPTTLDLALGVGGFISEDRINYKDVTSNAFLTFNKDVTNDLNLNVLVGNSIQSTRTDGVNTRGEKFALPFFYDLSNTSNLYALRSMTRRNIVGVFGDVKFGYRNGLFLNVTGRNDWSSTLPENSQSFFYPSVSMSYVFSDMHQLTSDFFTYGKIRASFAAVGKDAPPYYNGPYFNSAPNFPFNNIAGFVKNAEYSDPNLKPEKVKTIELGTELRFFKNRLGLDLTYYKTNSVDQIIPVPISYVTGYSFYNTNAGEIQNQGIEVLLTGKPLTGRRFTWDMSLNWSMNRSKVISIKEGINEIIFNNYERINNKLVVGGSAGDLWGRKYARDANGNLMIDANGYPYISQTYVKVGNAFPDWQAGLTNTFGFGGLSLSVLLEFRSGGDVHDVSIRNSIRNGVLKITENRYKQVLFKGVLADGRPNARPVMLDDNFYRSENNFNGASEVILQDASWLRIRNINLSYSIPTNTFGTGNFIKGVTVSAIANNFLLWTPFSGYDPEGSSFGSSSNAFGYMGYNVPLSSNVTFSVNVNF
jgi:TonB-linked SusC/RagA family outer membrane protein